MIGRSLSILIAAAYLVATYLTSDAATAFRVGLFLILPLACIWFSEAIGDYTGPGMGHGAVDTRTPGCLVAAGGWLLLLLPLAIAAIGTFRAP
jgi:hypothetical protein